MTWSEGALGEYRMVSSDGRVMGRVNHNHYRLEYEAIYGDRALGSYITLEHAKKAVEDAYANVGRVFVTKATSRGSWW